MLIAIMSGGLFLPTSGIVSFRYPFFRIHSPTSRIVFSFFFSSFFNRTHVRYVHRERTKRFSKLELVVGEFEVDGETESQSETLGARYV